MWNREPMLGEPVQDLATYRIGIAISINHASDTLMLEDADGHQWEVPLADTEPYAVTEY